MPGTSIADVATGDGRSRISAFLLAHRDFRLNLEEHVLARRQWPHVSKRLAVYDSYLHGDRTQVVDEASILRSLEMVFSRTVPAYRRPGGISRFSDIPFIRKSDIRAKPLDFFNEQHSGQTLWYKDTSGRTGQAVSIWYSDEFHFEYLFAPTRKLALLQGIKFNGSSPASCLTTDEGWRGPLGPLVIPDPSGGPVFTVVTTIRAESRPSLKKFSVLASQLSPEVLLTSPTALETLLAHDGTIWPAPPPRFIICGRSEMADSLRRRAQQLFDAPVHATYGMTEFGAIGFECAEHCGYHIDETSVLVEVVDEVGDRVPESQIGEIVVSSTANAAMPLLRYRTGDYGKLTRNFCRCGIPGPRLTSLSGWRATVFHFADHSIRSPAAFNEVLLPRPGLLIQKYKVSQPSADSIEITVQVEGGSVSPEARSGLFAAISDMLPPGVRLSLSFEQLDGSSTRTFSPANFGHEGHAPKRAPRPEPRTPHAAGPETNVD